MQKDDCIEQKQKQITIFLVQVKTAMVLRVRQVVLYMHFFSNFHSAKKKDAYWGHTRVIKQKEGPKLFACLRVLTFT